MRESNKLMRFLINDIQFIDSNFNLLDSKYNGTIVRPKRGFLKRDMESLIQHFKLSTEGYLIPVRETYRVVEAPKGEFGLGLTSDNTSKPGRCRIKAPGLLHLQALNYLSTDLLLSDLVTIIGTLDLVFGEIDK
jgi:NADH-quinone oxidoreductase subunit D